MMGGVHGYIWLTHHIEVQVLIGGVRGEQTFRV